MNILTFARNGTSRWLFAGVVVCVAIGALSLRSWTTLWRRKFLWRAEHLAITVGRVLFGAICGDQYGIVIAVSTLSVSPA